MMAVDRPKHRVLVGAMLAAWHWHASSQSRAHVVAQVGKSIDQPCDDGQYIVNDQKMSSLETGQLFDYVQI